MENNKTEKTEAERFVEVVEKTKKAFDSFKSSVESACKDLKSSIMEFGPGIETLPEHMQTAWLAGYVAQIKDVDSMINEAFK